jgi:retron-type reverse transcriptase
LEKPKLEEISKIGIPSPKNIYKAVREGDMVKARRFQKLLMRSHSAKMLAVRQVTQLNAGKKTAGIDGKKALKFHERFELVEKLSTEAMNWKHSKLREIPIPKKNGKTRILKVPTIADRAWQCLVKYALEPAHEATLELTTRRFWIILSLRKLKKSLTARIMVQKKKLRN